VTAFSFVTYGACALDVSTSGWRGRILAGLR